MIGFSISRFSSAISTAGVQSVDVREVHVEHNHVRLESLRCLEQCAAVSDCSHNLAVQRQRPSDGSCQFGVVVGYEHTGGAWTTLTSFDGGHGRFVP